MFCSLSSYILYIVLYIFACVNSVARSRGCCRIFIYSSVAAAGEGRGQGRGQGFSEVFFFVCFCLFFGMFCVELECDTISSLNEVLAKLRSMTVWPFSWVEESDGYSSSNTLFVLLIRRVD